MHTQYSHSARRVSWVLRLSGYMDEIRETIVDKAFRELASRGRASACSDIARGIVVESGAEIFSVRQEIFNAEKFALFGKCGKPSRISHIETRSAAIDSN